LTVILPSSARIQIPYHYSFAVSTLKDIVAVITGYHAYDINISVGDDVLNDGDKITNVDDWNIKRIKIIYIANNLFVTYEHAITRHVTYIPHMTKELLSAVLATQHYTPPSSSFLFFGQEILSSTTLQQCNIKPGYEIDCRSTLQQITLQAKNGLQWHMLVAENESIHIIKRNVHHRFKTVQFWLQLYLHDIELKDFKSLNAYTLTSQSSILCVFHCVFSVELDQSRRVFIDVDFFDTIHDVSILLSQKYNVSMLGKTLCSHFHEVHNDLLVRDFLKEGQSLLRLIHSPLHVSIRKEDHSETKLVINNEDMAFKLMNLLTDIPEFTHSHYYLIYEGRELLRTQKLFRSSTTTEILIHAKFDLSVNVTLTSGLVISFSCDRYISILNLKIILQKHACSVQLNSQSSFNNKRNTMKDTDILNVFLKSSSIPLTLLEKNL
jgi:hypothetical protein